MKISTFFRFALPAFLITIMLTGCGHNPFRPDYSLVPPPYDTTGAPRTELSDGLVYYTIDPGSGPFKVVPNDARVGVQINYTVRDKNGKILSSSYEKSSYGVPFIYSLAINLTNSTNEIYTEGFREGVLGMHKGEKRTIIAPPSLAYGSTNTSLADDTLYYDVEVVNFGG